MGSRFCAVMPAARFERFGPDSFGGQIGKAITVVDGNGEPAAGTLVGAEVRDDGREVLLTVEMPEGMRPSRLPRRVPGHGLQAG